MRSAIIIPSRLESTRLPEKALAKICGLPMIVHVLKRCSYASSVSQVFVATDSDRIKQVVEDHDLQVSQHAALGPPGYTRGNL